MPPAKHKTLPAFNDGYPLTVVRIPSEWEGEEDRFGVVNDSTKEVWIEYDLHPTSGISVRSLEKVPLPASFPVGYGRWDVRSIGGTGKTVRRIGVLCANPKLTGNIRLIATNAPTATCVEEALEDSEVATVGDKAEDAEYGHVCEVVVQDAAYVAHVAAVVARTGATPRFEDPSMDARRPLGIERLDRIGCRAEQAARQDDGEEDEQHGLRRGKENWRFPWLPSGWRAPITWDHMVANVAHVEDVTTLPQPLRQHVCLARLEHTEDEAERAALRKHVPATRIVSAGLTIPQAKQAIVIAYARSIEGVADPDVAHACDLVSYQLMVQRGFSGRRLGKYEQDAQHIGNGDNVRWFARLSQYETHRLPATVLNKICSRDGKLRGRGSKGSRSKYAEKSKRYKPKRRLVRTWADEEEMAS